MINKQALLDLFDDEALVSKYLQRFIEDMPRLLLQMRSAYAVQQWNEISIHAHSYKCQMQYIRDDTATRIAYELEKMGAEPNPDTTLMVTLMAQLENQLNHSIVEIQQIIG